MARTVIPFSLDDNSNFPPHCRTRSLIPRSPTPSVSQSVVGKLQDRGRRSLFFGFRVRESPGGLAAGLSLKKLGHRN